MSIVDSIFKFHTNGCLKQAEEGALPALLADLGVRLAADGSWLAGGMPEDRLLQALQLDQAASAVSATLICGLKDLLDASASEVPRSLQNCSLNGHKTNLYKLKRCKCLMGHCLRRKVHVPGFLKARTQHL